MKNAILTIFFLLTGFCFYAQNKNVQQETKTKVTTIKDSEGEHKIVSKKEIEKVQEVDVKNPKSNSTNKEMTVGPTEVSQKVQVTVDGVTRMIDKDRSGFYMYNGEKYQIRLDRVGYTIINPQTRDVLGKVREAPNGNYLVKGQNMYAMGYFDDHGNLVIQSHDDQTDSFKTEIIERIKE